jgi:pilus assembly protein CpaE
VNEPFTITVITTDPLFGLALDDLVSIRYLRRPWSDVNNDALEGKVLAKMLLEDDPLVVCLAPDVPESLALDVSRLLDEDHPDVAVVLVRVPTPELWREAARCGVRDIIDPDAADTELVPALTLAAERGERLRAASQTLGSTAPTGKVIVILSPKGGSGKTMVSTNLGVALAGTNSGDVALVDLDCAFGDVASVLGMVPDRTIGQLASMPSFDSTTLKVFLTRHEPSGLLVLAGSGLPEEGEAVTAQLSGQVIDILARDFAYVVVDTAAGLDERALAAIERATDVIFLASMDVASIRNLTKEVNALDRLQMTSAGRHFVLNRADTRVGLEVAEVEAALGMKVDAALPSSRMVPLSMNSGEVVVRQEPDSDVAKELIRLAYKFSPRPENAPRDEPERKGMFSRRRRS